MRSIGLWVMVFLALAATAGLAADQPAANPFAGTFTGAFSGDLSGTWQLVVAADGAAVATATTGEISGEIKGAVVPTGEIWATATRDGRTMLAAGLLQKVDGKVRGSGAWLVDATMKGVWRIGEPPAAAGGAGTFKGEYEGDDSGPFTLEVKADGQATATFDSPIAGQVTTTGKAADGKLELTGDVQGMALTVSGTFAGGAGSGTWALGSEASGKWKVEGPAAAPAPVAPAAAGSNPWAGSYAGTFSGIVSGSVALEIDQAGAATGCFDAGAVGKIDFKGTVGTDGQVALTGEVRGETLTLKGAFAKEGEATAAKGTWDAAGYSGEWTAAPAAK